MKDIRILMEDRCTETEAKKYLANGTTIYTEQELIQMINNEMSADRGFDDEDRQRYLDMIQTHTAVQDWSVVEHENKYYYIAYVL